MKFNFKQALTPIKALAVMLILLFSPLSSAQQMAEFVEAKEKALSTTVHYLAGVLQQAKSKPLSKEEKDHLVKGDLVNVIDRALSEQNTTYTELSQFEGEYHYELANWLAFHWQKKAVLDNLQAKVDGLLKEIDSQ